MQIRRCIPHWKTKTYTFRRRRPGSNTRYRGKSSSCERLGSRRPQDTSLLRQPSTVQRSNALPLDATDLHHHLILTLY